MNFIASEASSGDYISLPNTEMSVGYYQSDAFWGDK